MKPIKATERHQRLSDYPHNKTSHSKKLVAGIVNKKIEKIFKYCYSRMIETATFLTVFAKLPVEFASS